MSALTILRTNNKEVLYLSKELFVRAEEVAGALGISKPYAYKLVREMNEELILLMYLSRVFYRFFDFLLEKGRIKLNPQQLWIFEKTI